MAIINCPECQREVSSKAMRCPHCGFPMISNSTPESEQAPIHITSVSDSQKQSKDTRKRLVVIVACVAVILCIIVKTTNRPMHYDAPKTASYYSNYNNSSNQYYENATSVLAISNVKLTENSSYTIATGTLTNNGRNTYKFVKLKAVFKNYKGDILDTDSTYGCGDEGLAPNESTTFRMSISKNYSVSKVDVTVYDYDIK